MQDFYDILLPEQYSYGMTSGPRFKTETVIVQSGKEQRNGAWEDALWEFGINYTTQRKEQVQDLEDLYLQTKGSLISFLFNNKKDNTVTIAESLANDNGILKGKPKFKLCKKYQQSLTYAHYSKRIYKPAPGSVKIYNNGVLQTWTVDYDQGVVSLPVLSSKEITGISKASNGVVTSVAHGFTTGNKIFLSNITGMTQLNNRVFTITYLTVDTFALNVNTLAYTNFVYVSGNKTYAKKYINGTENITFTCDFYFPVRFKEDTLVTSYDTFNSFTCQCGLTEIRYDEVDEINLDW